MLSKVFNMIINESKVKVMAKQISSDNKFQFQTSL